MAAIDTESTMTQATSTTAPAGRRSDVVRGHRATTVGTLLVILAGFLVYLVNTNASPLGDAAAAVPIATSIVRDGDLELDEYRGAPGFADGGWVTDEDGRLVGFFPWAVAVSAVPAVLAVDAAQLVGVGDGSFEIVFDMADGHARLQSVVAAFWTAVSVGGVFALARRRLRAGVTASVAVAGVYAFGTTAWSTAAFQLWQHGPSLACVTWSIVLLDRLIDRAGCGSDRRRLVEAGALGALAAAAYAVRPTNAIFVVALSVWAMSRLARGDRRVPAAIAAGALAVSVPWLLATRATYGSWFQPYGRAGRIGWHDAYVEALVANLVSPGRGLLVFSPILVLAIVGAVRAVARPGEADALTWIALAVTVIHWLAVSALGHWVAGHSFGPRLFTDVLPFLVVLSLPVVDQVVAAATRGRIATLVVVGALAVISIAVHAQSTLVISTRCWNATPVDVDDDASRVWDWGDPMVTTGYRDLARDPMASLRGQCTREGAAGTRP